MKKVKHSFATLHNPMTGETFCEVEDVAEYLAKGWGDIPKYINDIKAVELHLLGKSYLELLKRVNKVKGGSDE